jgi:hypothetical protein
VDLHQRVFGDSCEFLVIVCKVYVGDTTAVSNYGIAETLVGLSVEQRYRTVVVPA